MYKFSQSFVRFCLLIALTLVPVWATAADSASSSQTQNDSTPAPVKIVASVELSKLQKRLDAIKQQVSTATTDSQLTGLYNDSLTLANDAEALSAALQPDRAQIQAQLDVLGPAPVQGAMPETAVVAQQRNALNSRRAQLDSQIERVQSIKTGATNLSTQIVDIRRNALRTQMAFNSGSILGGKFWSPLLEPRSEDQRRISDFRQQIEDAWALSWQPDWRVGTSIFLLLAAAIWISGVRLLDYALAWLCTHWLPEGHLRRSFLACATALTTVLALGLGAELLLLAFTRHPDVSPAILDFGNQLFSLTLFSALIVGLGRAFLSIRRPTWRLASMSNPIALALRSTPKMLAVCILLFGAVEQVNNIIGTSVSTTIFGNGIAALLVGLIAFISPVRVNRLRRQLAANGEQPEGRSTLAGLIHLSVCLTGISILLSLLIGYIALARFLTYELIWVGMVLSCLYLLLYLVNDLCESLFSTQNASGKMLKNSLNLDERHLAQAATLFSAIGKTLLILLAAVALFNGAFGTTTPMTLFNKAIEMWGGKGLETLNIVPSSVMHAFLCLGIGLYVLRTAKRWLDKEFLPKTMMDIGIRSSLVTLFSNIGYVLVLLMTLATLGIQWNKLAWIVSALSVGIGFGLQEIVKNFISGLILLTERPVKVGDLISIAGVEGDIRRINVRATEIQLSDRSTVIVPNSQLISQNVRNATMGNAQGVATIALTFPLDIDPEQVRTLLLDAYEAHESILPTPAPSVKFSQLGPEGIVLSVTGYVSSPRMVSAAKSDLLFEILKRLREAKVALSSPRTMILQQPVPQDPGVE